MIVADTVTPAERLIFVAESEVDQVDALSDKSENELTTGLTVEGLKVAIREWEPKAFVEIGLSVDEISELTIVVVIGLDVGWAVVVAVAHDEVLIDASENELAIVPGVRVMIVLEFP